MNAEGLAKGGLTADVSQKSLYLADALLDVEVTKSDAAEVYRGKDQGSGDMAVVPEF